MSKRILICTVFLFEFLWSGLALAATTIEFEGFSSGIHADGAIKGSEYLKRFIKFNRN
jgi:hypothetical protein